jgi:hypothetical protein
MRMLTRMFHGLANTEFHQASAAAQRLARDRLASREPVPVDRLIEECRIEARFSSRASRLLRTIGEAIAIDPRLLRPDDRFGEILSVSHAELGPEASAVLTKNGITGPFEVHGYDLFDALEKIADTKEWIQQRAELSDPPQSEDEWLDRIMRMTVCEFVNYFAPTMTVGTSLNP